MNEWMLSCFKYKCPSQDQKNSSRTENTAQSMFWSFSLCSVWNRKSADSKTQFQFITHFLPFPSILVSEGKELSLYVLSRDVNHESRRERTKWSKGGRIKWVTVISVMRDPKAGREERKSRDTSSSENSDEQLHFASISLSLRMFRRTCARVEPELSRDGEEEPRDFLREDKKLEREWMRMEKEGEECHTWKEETETCVFRSTKSVKVLFRRQECEFEGKEDNGQNFRGGNFIFKTLNASSRKREERKELDHVGNVLSHSSIIPLSVHPSFEPSIHPCRSFCASSIVRLPLWIPKREELWDARFLSSITMFVFERKRSFPSQRFFWYRNWIKGHVVCSVLSNRFSDTFAFWIQICFWTRNFW